MGNLALEAYFRLHAGTRLLDDDRAGEGEIEARTVAHLYREVDASHYVAEIEAALAEAQRDSA